MSGSAPLPAWAPGYETSTQLRQGRRARIFRAVRVTSGAEVVLKVLPMEAGQSELGHLRTLDGVPGVVPLLDAGSTADGAFFVVTPFYPDGSFGEMLARKGPAPIQEAAAVARSVAGALGALHARGLLHNDISPGNVLRAGRTPVLTGFGAICRIGEALSPPPAQMESFLHSPPESLRGEPRTAASDVYQLASTVWTMLTGRAPFSTTDGSPFDPRAYAQRVLSEEIAPVPRQDVSRSLRGVLTRALAKDPATRHASPAEFAAAFEKARSGRPGTAPSGAQTSMLGAPVDASTGPRPAASGPQEPLAHSGPQTPPVSPETWTSAAPSGAQAPFPSASGPQAPFAAPSGPQAAFTTPSGPQAPIAPPSGPQTAFPVHPSGAQTPFAAPSGPQAPIAPPSGPQTPFAAPSGPQISHLSSPSGPHTPPPPPPPSPRPPQAPPVETGPAQPPSTPPEDRSRLASASSLRPPQRALPTPEERERHGAVPEASPHSTADLMMAKLRGEEVSPLRAWARLEGWKGDAESAYLPADEIVEERSSDPEWDSLSTPLEPPRWRKQMHIGVTVCGVLLVTVVGSAFAARTPSQPVVETVASEEVEATKDEETAAEPVAAPSPLPEGSPPSEVRLDDTLSAVTLSWTDHTGGTGSYFVVGGPQGHAPVTLARTGPGAVTAQVPTDDTQAEYCFVVVAVDGGAAPAEEVCTTRAAERAAEAERLAEEEAAAEEEEEEEEEPDPSPSPSPNADE